MRDSKSVDLERNDDIIHATATSPSAFTQNGHMSPGMLTPKELTDSGLASPEVSRSRSRSGSAVKSAGSGGGKADEKNPFGDFSSVTRDIGDWQ